MANTRSRTWTIVLNNYTIEEVQSLFVLAEQLSAKKVAYLCWAPEVGESGTPHLQGYVAMKNARTVSATKKVLGSKNWHLINSNGDAQQNKLYCQKLDPKSVAAGIPPNVEFYEFGTLPRQGNRTDLDEIKELIEDGSTEEQIAQQFFGQWIRYRVGFRAYRDLINLPIAQPRYQLTSFPIAWQSAVFNWEKTVILWGKSGIGKTEFALAILPGCLIVSHMDDLKNFDKEKHSGIIFDDVDIAHFPRTAQIHLLDQTQDRSIHIRYACGFIPKHTKKIFTSNVHNGACCLLDDGAIRRRVDVHHLVMGLDE